MSRHCIYTAPRRGHRYCRICTAPRSGHRYRCRDSVTGPSCGQRHQPRGSA